MPLKVFVSYASPDEDAFLRLAQHLKPLVRAGAIVMWSPHDVQAGQEAAKERQARLNDSQLVLALCSADYLASEEGYQELRCAIDRLRKKDADLLPIRWAASLWPDELQSFPYLPHAGPEIKQRSGQAQQDDAWVEVAQRVSVRAMVPAESKPPARRTSRKALERERQHAQAHGFIVDEPQDLLCNRSEQWQALDTLVQRPEHAAFLLPGKQGQGHEYFNLRVLVGLRRDPPRDVIWLASSGHIPRDEQSYREALARALECTEKQLPSELRRRMAKRNLVLLHPAADALADRQAVKDCLTHWLPGLLGEAAPSCFLKCIQPIRWELGPPGLLRRIRRLLLPGSRWDALSDFCRKLIGSKSSPFVRRLQSTSEDAGALIASLRAEVEVQSTGTWLIRPLAELTQIRQEHVEALCDNLGIRDPLRSEFTRRVFDPATDSEAILRSILREIKDFKPPRPNDAGPAPAA